MSSMQEVDQARIALQNAENLQCSVGRAHHRGSGRGRRRLCRRGGGTSREVEGDQGLRGEFAGEKQVEETAKGQRYDSIEGSNYLG